MALELKIVTPDSEALRTTCDEVTAPGLTGEIGFGTGHVPLVTALKPGVLTVVSGSQRTVYAIGSGFAEIDAEVVTILTESCQISSKVNVEQARKDIAEAEKALASIGEPDPSFVVHRRRLERAQARINAAQLGR